MNEVPVYTISMPQYTVESVPDHNALGNVVDQEIRRYFLGKSILVRGLASAEHANKSIDELIQIIKSSGTDRYDPNNAGDRYENIEDKQIDLFAFPHVVTQEKEIFAEVVWGFYHSAKAIHGRPVRIDILIIYDANQMQPVEHQYQGVDEIKNDGYVFKNPSNKSAAILAIFKLTD